MEALAYYGGLFDRGELSDVQAALTWCRGVPVEDVIVRLGAEPASGVPMTVREAYDGEAHYDLAIVAEIGGAVLIAEPFGGTAAQPELAKRLSSGRGLVVGVSWNVEHDNHLTVAEDGLSIVQFDMRDPEDRFGRDPDRFAPLLEGFDTDDWMAAGLALAESIVGVRLPADWMSIRGLAVRVVPPPQDLVPEHYWNHPVLEEPQLAAILRGPQSEHLPWIARVAAETAVRHTGLDGDSVTATVAWLDHRRNEEQRAWLQAEMARLSNEMRQRSFEAQKAEGGTSVEGSQSRTLFRQADAALALSEALGDDVMEAAYRSVSRASRLGLSEDDGLRLTILQRCAHRIRWG